MAPGAPDLAAGVRGDMTDRERLLDVLRPVAFAIAYRMLGSVSEAEDVVQEALLRLNRALEAGEQIASPHAFVTTVTTRLAINELRSARARRGEAKAEALKLTGETGTLLKQSIREARKLAQTARLRARGRGARAASRSTCSA